MILSLPVVSTEAEPLDFVRDRLREAERRDLLSMICSDLWRAPVGTTNCFEPIKLYRPFPAGRVPEIHSEER
jgi:hypothetical protein